MFRSNRKIRQRSEACAKNTHGFVSNSDISEHFGGIPGNKKSTMYNMAERIARLFWISAQSRPTSFISFTFTAKLKRKIKSSVTEDFLIVFSSPERGLKKKKKSQIFSIRIYIYIYIQVAVKMYENLRRLINAKEVNKMASKHLYTLTVISKIKMAGITTTNEHVLVPSRIASQVSKLAN